MAVKNVHQFKHKVPNAYRVIAKGESAEIYLYGVIGADWFGDGITAKKFSDDLKALGKVKNIDIRINSPGGDVFEGRAIYTLLQNHDAKITVYVDAEASSIASLIAMAGDTIHMAQGTLMMIHCAWGFTVGNAEEIRKQANLLDVVDQTLVDTYAARTKQDAKQVKKWMDAETWMTAEEAVERGFADVVDEPLQIAAFRVDREKFQCKKTPEAIRPNRAAALQLIKGGTKK